MSEIKIPIGPAIRYVNTIKHVDECLKGLSNIECDEIHAHWVNQFNPPPTLIEQYKKAAFYE